MDMDALKNMISQDDGFFASQDKSIFGNPRYNPETHYLELTQSPYFKALLILRHYIKATSDVFSPLNKEQ